MSGSTAIGSTSIAKKLKVNSAVGSAVLQDAGTLLFETNADHDLVDALVYIETAGDENSNEATFVKDLIAEEARAIEKERGIKRQSVSASGGAGGGADSTPTGSTTAGAAASGKSTYGGVLAPVGCSSSVGEAFVASLGSESDRIMGSANTSSATGDRVVQADGSPSKRKRGRSSLASNQSEQGQGRSSSPDKFLNSLQDQEVQDSTGDTTGSISRNILHKEWQRLAESRAMAPFDKKQYMSMDGPGVFDRNKEEAWREALDQAKINVQCNELRLANLEHLLRYGKKAASELRKSNQAVEGQLGHEVATLKRESEQINQKRKLAQIAGQSELQNLRAQYEKYLTDNFKTENALLVLRTEVEKLKRVAKRRKLLTADWQDPTLLEDPSSKKQDGKEDRKQGRSSDTGASEEEEEAQGQGEEAGVAVEGTHEVQAEVEEAEPETAEAEQEAPVEASQEQEAANGSVSEREGVVDEEQAARKSAEEADDEGDA
ncbi:unnamed protein product [Amoebophrya sp. A25]|nr:unnamed protein product [Amoebophrya sp. A25]|eukprot:GSA25T00004720001.1